MLTNILFVLFGRAENAFHLPIESSLRALLRCNEIVSTTEMQEVLRYLAALGTSLIMSQKSIFTDKWLIAN